MTPWEILGKTNRITTPHSIFTRSAIHSANPALARVHDRHRLTMEINMRGLLIKLGLLLVIWYEVAAELHGAGIFTSAIRGDVAKLWYDDLRVHLRENRLPVAGATDRAELFCLEELARDVGMRVIFRVDHMMDENRHTQHNAVGPASPVAVARNMPQEAGFGRAIAVLFSQFDINEPRNMAVQKLTGPFSPENKTALVSWLIA